MPAWVRSQEPQVISELSLSCHPQSICSPSWRSFFRELLGPHPTVSSAPTHPKPRKSKSRPLHLSSIPPSSVPPSLLPFIQPPTRWVEEVTFPLGQGDFLLLPSLLSLLPFYFLWCMSVCIHMQVHMCAHGCMRRNAHTYLWVPEDNLWNHLPSACLYLLCVGSLVHVQYLFLTWILGTGSQDLMRANSSPTQPLPSLQGHSFLYYFFHVLFCACCSSLGFRDPWPCRKPLVYVCSPLIAFAIYHPILCPVTFLVH